MQSTISSQGSLARILLTVASFIVVVAGMRAAQSIIVPFLLSLFLAVVSAPAFFFLKRKHIPDALSLLLVIMGIVGIASSAALLIGTSLRDFVRSVPRYQAQLEENSVRFASWLEASGIEIPYQNLAEYLDLGATMRFAGNMLSELSGMFANGFLILLAMAFMLAEASSVPLKLRAAFGKSKASSVAIKQFTSSVNRYMAIKTGTSLATGILVALFLLSLGVDYPMLWGFLAFLLNFVPNLGSIIAAVPAVLLALVQLGPTSALIVAGGYLVLNTVIGSFVEPRLMGRSLGLSTLIVFLSLVFWGWVLGPVGMLLSVPLTITVKIALQSSQDTKWISIMLGSGSDAHVEALCSSLTKKNG